MIDTTGKKKRRGRGRARAQEAATRLFDGTPPIARGMSRPGLSFLSDAEIDIFRDRSFQLLWRHGVAIDHPEAVRVLRKAGAKPASDGKRFKLPTPLVQEALDATPKHATLCAKTPNWDLDLPRTDGTFIMRTGTGAHGFVDVDTGDYRNMGLDDVSRIARVGSCLDQVGFIAHPFVYGVPELTSDIHGVGRLICETPKHIWLQPYNLENVDYLMRICAIAAGGEQSLRERPIASCIATAFTPLEIKAMDVEAIIQSGRYGLPIHACSLPTSAGTGPITMPGSVLMASAEILMMVTLAYLLGPPTPVIATPLIFSLDVRTGRPLQSNVEVLQGASMAAQLMKHGFGLITHSYGAGADTPAPDAQAQAEVALRAQTVSLAGADILGGVGQLECATVFSPVQAAMDNEVGAMVNRFLQAPPVDDESLAWEQMLAVDVGGHFLSNEHTVRHCRNLFTPRVFQRIDRDTYDKSGRRDALHNARDLCNEFLARPSPPGLPDEHAAAEIQSVVQAADAAIVDG